MMDCPSNLAGLEAAFGTGLVLGAAVFFAIGVLVGIAWTTAIRRRKTP